MRPPRKHSTPSLPVLLLLCLAVLAILAGGIRLAEALMPGGEDGGGHPIEIDPGDGGGGGGGGGEPDPIPPEDGSKLLAELSNYYQAVGQQAADPVQLPGGHFTECRTDLFVPGRGLDFEWRRCYRSSIGPYQVPEHTIMGVNWYVNYDQRLELDLDSNGYWDIGRAIHWRNGTGGMEEFTPQQESDPENDEWHSRTSGSTLRAGVSSTGIENAILTTPDGLIRRFAVPGGDSGMQLQSIEDRNGNRITLEWTVQWGSTLLLLTGVTDTMGREYVVDYVIVNNDWVVDSVTDFAGRRVDYEYVSVDNGPTGLKGDLKTVWLPEISGTSTGNDFDALHGNRKAIRYTYAHGHTVVNNQIVYPDGNLHQMITAQDPGGAYLRNWYGWGTVINPVSGSGQPLRLVAQVWGDQTFTTNTADPSHPKNFCQDPANMDPDIAPPGDIYCFQYVHYQMHKMCEDWQDHEPAWTGGRLECEQYWDAVAAPGSGTGYNYLAHQMMARVVTVREKDRVGQLKVHRYHNDTKNTLVATHIVTTSANPALIFAPYDPWHPENDPLTNAPGVMSTQYEYNDMQQLTRIESPRGRVREIVLDEDATDPLFRTVPRQIWEVEVEERELLQEALYEDPRFPLPTRLRTPKPDHPTDMVEVVYTYDAAGNVDTVTMPSLTRPDGSVLTRQQSNDYNSFGQLTRSVDAEGNVTVNEYYPECELQGVSPQDCDPITGGYLRRLIADAEDDPNRNRDFDTEPNSPPAVQATIEYIYNGLGNAIEITDARGVITEREYNQQGHVVSEVRDPGGDEARRRWVYNANGQVVREDEEERYEGASRWISAISTYDNLNTLLTQTRGKVVDDPGNPGVTSRIIHDRERRVIGAVFPEGNATWNVLDALSMPIQTRVGCTWDGAEIDCGAESTTRVFAYDLDGRKIEERTPLGFSTHFQYDNRDRLIRVLRPDGSGTEFEPDRLGLVLVSKHYDKNAGTLEAGQITFVGLPLVRQETDYDEAGTAIRTRVIDPRATPPVLVGQSKVFSDGLGRAVKVEDGIGAESLVRYDGLGRPVWAQDPSGREVISSFDDMGNLEIQTVRRFAQSADFDTPPVNVAPMIDQTSSFEFDNLGRLETATDALGASSTNIYDSRGILRQLVDPLGNISRFEPDTLGQVVRAVREKREGGIGTGALEVAIETTFEYNDNGKLVKQWDHLGRLTEFEFDLHERPVRRTFAGLPGDTPRTARFFPDADGRVIATIDDRDYCLDQEYDAMGRVTRINSYESCTVTNGVVGDFERGGLKGTSEQTFEHDGLGRMVHHTDDNGDDGEEVPVEGTLHYDVRGLLLEESVELPHPVTGVPILRTVGHVYDPAGRQTVLRYPAASQVAGVDLEIDRDDSGRILSLTPKLGGVGERLAAYRYEGEQLRRRAFYNPATGNAVSNLERSYDEMRRLLTHSETAAGTGAPIFARELRFDPMGNTTMEFDGVRQKGRVFRYDSLYRLDGYRWDLPNTSNQLLSVANHETLNAEYEGLAADPVASARRDYDLDEADNWTATHETLPGAQNPTSVSFDTNNFNEIESRGGQTYNHDPSGNMLEEPTTPSQGGRFFYEYDFANRLIRVCSGGACQAGDTTTVAKYFYDALGRRVRKVLWNGGAPQTIDFVLSGEQILEERIVSASADRLERRYFYRASLSSLEAMDQFDEVGAESRFYLHRDYQGSVSAVTRGDGAPWSGSGPQATWARTFRYDVYGALIEDSNPASAVVVPFRYGSHYLDVETGLYYMRARYYRPEIGRFLSRDPLMYVDGMNIFAYARNNPASLVDPMGTDSMSNDEADRNSDKKDKPKKPKKPKPPWKDCVERYWREWNSARAGAGFIGAYSSAAHALMRYDSKHSSPGYFEPTGKKSGSGESKFASFDVDSARFCSMSDNASTEQGGHSSPTDKVQGSIEEAIDDEFEELIRVSGGTPEERESVEEDARIVLNTPRGKQMAEEIARRRWGPVDVLLNNAGQNQAPHPGGHLHLDPNSHPMIMTTQGMIPCTNQRILAHELGHAVFGARDDGPGRMSNVLQNENPIMSALNQPSRTRY